jgi:nucleoside-diphosphate-sugar epimerase
MILFGAVNYGIAEGGAAKVESQRLLVTGGSGFIGTHLIEAALDIGDEVINLDIEAPLRLDQAVYWRKDDLLNPNSLADLVRHFRPDVIINLAAIADISFKYNDMPVNTIGVKNIIDAAKAVVPRPRIVHVSTQLVVAPGNESAGPREYFPYTEYGRTKAESERILWECADDLVWTVLRPTNVWGPWHRTFVNSTWNYLQRRWYMVPTGPSPIRSYGYVKNVASQILKSAHLSDGAVNRKIFYVGDPPISSHEWLDGFSLSLTGRPVRRVPISALKLLARGGELAKQIGIPAPFDNGRLFRISSDYAVPMEASISTLGSGSTSLEEGIASTTQWLRFQFPKMFQRS